MRAPLCLRLVGCAQAAQIAERLHEQAENARLAFGAGMGGVFNFAFGARDFTTQRPHEAALQRQCVERFVARLHWLARGGGVGATPRSGQFSRLRKERNAAGVRLSVVAILVSASRHPRKARAHG